MAPFADAVGLVDGDEGDREVLDGRQEGRVRQAFKELPHLVAHERDQGRDHDGGAAERDGGDLVDQRFARSGGHDGQHVAFPHDGLDGSFLLRAEPVVPEAALQHFFRLLER